MAYDPLDPYGVNSGQDQPQPTPRIPGNYPTAKWTDAEMQEVRKFSHDWRTDHNITKGKEGDLAIAYENLREQGLSHDDARQGAINVLGWQGDAATPTAPSSGGSGGFDTALTQPFTQQFNAPPPVNLGGPAGIPYVPQTPNYTAPAFQPPAYKQAPEFSYAPFQGIDAESFKNTPGYQGRLNQGIQTLENDRASKGILGTGGTLKDILGYGQEFASNEYGNEWNRALTQYQTNRSNAVDSYNTNYGTQYVDPYKASYQGALDAFAPQMAQFNANVGAGNLGYSTQAAAGQHQSDANTANAWNSYIFDYNNQRNNRLDTFNMQSSVLGL